MITAVTVKTEVEIMEMVWGRDMVFSIANLLGDDGDRNFLGGGSTKAIGTFDF